MSALLDTSFLLAMTNPKDNNHDRALTVAQTINVPLVLSVTVLPEICYLLASRMGHKTMRVFLERILATDEITLESLNSADLKRVIEILTQYADSKLDFVDATLVAIAERRNITRILTFDRRDFSIIRPNHINYFDILP